MTWAMFLHMQKSMFTHYNCLYFPKPLYVCIYRYMTTDSKVYQRLWGAWKIYRSWMLGMYNVFVPVYIKHFFWARPFFVSVQNEHIFVTWINNTAFALFMLQICECLSTFVITVVYLIAFYHYENCPCNKQKEKKKKKKQQKFWCFQYICSKHRFCVHVRMASSLFLIRSKKKCIPLGLLNQVLLHKIGVQVGTLFMDMFPSCEIIL